MTRAVVTRRELAARTAVVVTGPAVAAVAAVPDLNRFVLLLGGFTVVASVLAAVIPWRLTGTVAVVTATLTVLLAGALDASSLRPVQAMADAALLLALVSALAGREDSATRSAHAANVAGRTLVARSVPYVVALGAGALVALTAAQDVVPSVPLVLAGLLAAVVALVVAAGAHRS